MRMRHFGPNMVLTLFILQNFKKFLPADPELREYTIFGSKMTHFPK